MMQTFGHVSVWNESYIIVGCRQAYVPYESKKAGAILWLALPDWFGHHGVNTKEFAFVAPYDATVASVRSLLKRNLNRNQNKTQVIQHDCSAECGISRVT